MTYSRVMSMTSSPAGSIVRGFGTFRLFRPGRADELISASRRRQEQHLRLLRTLYPAPKPPLPNKSSR